MACRSECGQIGMVIQDGMRRDSEEPNRLIRDVEEWLQQQRMD